MYKNHTLLPTQLAYVQYFSFADKYLEVYAFIAKKIQEPGLSKIEKDKFFTLSESLMQQSFEFQKKGLSNLTYEIKCSVNDLTYAVKFATKTIHDTYRSSNLKDVISGLVAIAEILNDSVFSSTNLKILPKLIKKLIHDVNELKKTNNLPYFFI